MSGRYALMWSGGKDSALALHRAVSAGVQIAGLITFHDASTGRVRFHATRVDMIRAQAEAAGLELKAIGSSWREMEGRLMAELTALRAEGYAGIVFGDIYLADGRSWFEERVRAAGLEYVEPIRGEASAGLLREFVETGGRAVITCVDLSRLDQSWLVRIIDERFPSEIATTGADPCGENGEYHSFVFQAPVFKRPVRWRSGEIRSEPGFSQLDVLPG